MKSLFTFLAALLMPVFLFAAPPVITEPAAVVELGKKAAVTGKIAGDGTDVTVTVHYGLTTAYELQKQEVIVAAARADAPFRASLTGLTEGATYHYKIVANNGVDPHEETGDFTFVVPPVITTVRATPEVGARAKIAGTVNTGGFATTATVQFGETINYGNTELLAVTAAGEISGEITGLKFGKLYHYRVKAKNTGGEGVVSADATFTTVPVEEPKLDTLTRGNFVVDATGKVSVPITAEVTGNGHNTRLKLVWGKTSPPKTQLPLKPFTQTDVDKLATFQLTDLEVGETYYYQLTLTKENATIPTYDSGVLQFTVDRLKPVFLSFKSKNVSVQNAVNVISSTTAEITVLVDPLGKDAEISAEYGKAVAPAPTYGPPVEIVGTGDAPASLRTGDKERTFAKYKSTIVLTGLEKGKYNYRITADNGPAGLNELTGATTTANFEFTIPGNVELKATALEVVDGKLNGGSVKVRAIVTAHGESVNLVFTLNGGGGEPVVVTREAVVLHDGVKQPVDVEFGNLTPGTAYTFTVEASHTEGASTATASGAFRTATDYTNTLEGVNSGLIKDADGNVAGGFKIIGAKGGKFTARVNIGGKSHVVSGQLDGEGQFRATTTDGFFFAVQASPTGGVDGAPTKLDLTVARGDQKYTADVTVNAVTPARMKELAGLYTLAIAAPGGTAAEGESTSGLPGGAGYIRMSVKEWGGVSVKGVLGDGSKFSYSSTLAGTDAASGVPLWLSPKDARVSGTVTLVGEEDVTATGDLKWYRPADKGAKRFEDGFYTSVDAVGGPYVAPTGRQRILNADTSDVTITFSGGDLLSNIVVNGTIDSQNRIQFPKGALKNMKIDNENGIITGTVEHSRTGQDVKFVTAIVKDKATGSFGGTTTTGTVNIAAGRTVPQPTQPQPQPDNNGNPGSDLGGLGQ